MVGRLEGWMHRWGGDRETEHMYTKAYQMGGPESECQLSQMLVLHLISENLRFHTYKMG